MALAQGMSGEPQSNAGNASKNAAAMNEHAPQKHNRCYVWLADGPRQEESIHLTLPSNVL